MPNGHRPTNDLATEDNPAMDAARIGRIEANHESLAKNVSSLTDDVRELARNTNQAIQSTQAELRSMATLLSQKIDTQNEKVMGAISAEHQKNDARESGRLKGIAPVIIGIVGVATTLLTVFIASETRPLAADIRKADDTLKSHETRLDRIEDRRGEQAASIARLEQWKEDFEKYAVPQMMKGKP